MKACLIPFKGGSTDRVVLADREVEFTYRPLAGDLIEPSMFDDIDFPMIIQKVEHTKDGMLNVYAHED